MPKISHKELLAKKGFFSLLMGRIKDEGKCEGAGCRLEILLGFCLYPINPGRFSSQYRTGADRCTPTLPR